jgi:hypothetical protein
MEEKYLWAGTECIQTVQNILLANYCICVPNSNTLQRVKISFDSSVDTDAKHFGHYFGSGL